MLSEHGGHLKFTNNWARNVLSEVQRSEKKMVKRMVTTLKIPVAPGLLKEEQLTFQRKIQTLIKWHDIPKDLVLNFDQTPLSYITVGNNTLEFEGAKSVPVKVKGKGKQITNLLLFLPLTDFYRCNWYTLLKLNAVTLKVSSFDLVLMLLTHLIIRVTKSWPFNISVRL